MKKVLSTLFAAGVIALVACGPSAEKAPETTTPEATEAPAQEAAPQESAAMADTNAVMADTTVK